MIKEKRKSGQLEAQGGGNRPNQGPLLRASNTADDDEGDNDIRDQE